MFKLSLMEGLKNIDKNRTLTFLTVLLFTFLFLLQGYTFSYHILNTELHDFLSEDSFSQYQVYRFSAKMPSLMIFNIEGYNDIGKEFSEFCQALDEIENLNYNLVEESRFYVMDFKGHGTLNEDGTKTIFSLECSPSFHRTENYRVILGRNLTDEDSVYIDGEPRPILLGYKLKDYYSVGDIIKVLPDDNPNNITYYFDSLKVVGILAEDSTYVDCYGSTIYDLDNAIIYPGLWINYDELSNYEKDVKENALNMERLAFDHIKLMFNEEHKEEVVGEVQNALNNFLSLSKYYNIVDSKYALEKMESRSAAVIEFSSTITTVLMVFAFITVLISIVNRVTRNLRDYSIHIALGASRGNIVGFVVSEMSLVLLCSIILGTAVTRMVTHSLYIYFDLFRFLGVYIATSLFVLLISAITAVIAIRRSDICTLIK